MRLPGITYKGTPRAVTTDVNAPLRMAAAAAGAVQEVGKALEEYKDREEDHEDREASLGLSNDMTTFSAELEAQQTFETAGIDPSIQVNRDKAVQQNHTVSAEMYQHFGRKRIAEYAKGLSNQRKRADWVADQTIILNRNFLGRKTANLKKQKAILDGLALENIIDARDRQDFNGARAVAASSGLPADIVAKENRETDYREERAGVDNSIADNDLNAINMQIDLLRDTKKSPYTGTFNTKERATEVTRLRAAQKKLTEHNKEDNRRAAAQDATARILRERGGKSPAELRAEARKLPSEIQDSVITRLNASFNSTEVDKNRRERDAYDDAYAQAEANPGRPIRYSPDMPPGKRHALEVYQAKLASGVPIMTKPEVYNEVDALRLSQNEADHQKFMALDLSDPKYLNGLSKGDRSIFKNEQEKMGKPGSRAKVPGHATVSNTWERALGFKTPAKRSPEAHREAMELRRGLDTLLQAEADRKGQDLTQSEIEGFAHEFYMAKVTAPGSGKLLGRTQAAWVVRLFGLDDEQVTNFQSIPRDDRIEIIDELNAEGKAVTPQRIIERHLRKQGVK